MSLRRTLSVALTLLAGLAFIAAISLSAITSYLHRVTTEVRAAHESIRLAQEMEIDVLAHARTPKALGRTSIEERVRSDLRRMEKYVEDENERTAYEDAVNHIDSYFRYAEPLETAENLPQLETTFNTLRELVDINVGQADRADADAAAWDNLADGVGIAVAGLLLIGITTLLAWLWMFAFRPTLDIRNAMHSFATGKQRRGRP